MKGACKETWYMEGHLEGHLKGTWGALGGTWGAFVGHLIHYIYVVMLKVA